MRRTSASWPKPAIYHCQRLSPANELEASVSNRQEKIPGFNQGALQNAKIILVGAGGLGSEYGEGLARKGVGCLKIFDGDVVELSNLNRQKFYPQDVYQNKAIAIAKNLSKEGFLGSEIVGYPFTFEEAFEMGLDLACHLALCGVDNNQTRVFVSKHFQQKNVPVIFVAASADADHGYIFIQESGKACWGCLYPDAVNDKKHPCPDTPAVKDILKVMGGLALYAVDTLLMPRKRNWNYRMIFLNGETPDGATVIEKRADCPLCGKE